MIASTTIIWPLLPEWPALDPQSQIRIMQHAAGFARRSIALAPAYVRTGVIVLSIALHSWLVLSAPFAGQASPARRRAVAAFQRMRGPPAAVVRLYRSLTVLAFYEHPLVVAAMAGEDATSRQERFRADRRARIS